MLAAVFVDGLLCVVYVCLLMFIHMGCTSLSACILVGLDHWLSEVCCSVCVGGGILCTEMYLVYCRPPPGYQQEPTA